jgi:hypothetical protein
MYSNLDLWNKTNIRGLVKTLEKKSERFGRIGRRFGFPDELTVFGIANQGPVNPCTTHCHPRSYIFHHHSTMKFQPTVTKFLCSYANAILGCYLVDPQKAKLGASLCLSPVQGDNSSILNKG